MKSKFLKFKGKKPDLVSHGPAISSDGEIVDHGTLGNLKYEIYKRGVIKIFSDGIDLVFKKDINIFEQEIARVNFSEISDQLIIKGSGDNDHLIFTKIEGDIEISLKKREFSAIETLQEILKKGRKKVEGL